MVMAVMNQSVAVFNRTSSTLDQLPNTEGVLSVAVDWLTQRIFWANPHRQMVSSLHSVYVSVFVVDKAYIMHLG